MFLNSGYWPVLYSDTRTIPAQLVKLVNDPMNAFVFVEKKQRAVHNVYATVIEQENFTEGDVNREKETHSKESINSLTSSNEIEIIDASKSSIDHTCNSHFRFLY